MSLYLDASALVKAFLAEEVGSSRVVEAMEAESRMVTARHAFVESGRAIAKELGRDHPALVAFLMLWEGIDVIEITYPLCERALEITSAHGLPTLDALHLAAALADAGPDLLFATWDRDLWEAASAEGLAVLPERRP